MIKKFFIASFATITIAFALVWMYKHLPFSRASTRLQETFAIQKRLQTFYPIQKDQQFVIVVHATNASETCQRQLESIFHQVYSQYRLVYIDNGSVDQTHELVHSVCKREKKESKLTLVRHAKKKAAMEVIYETIHALDPSDIVIVLEGHDWLSHEYVLDHLNCAYAHPDVWLTYSRTIRHPDYRQVEGHPYSDQFLLEKQFRKKGELPLSSLVSFPAAYFKEIRLESFLFEGRFINEKSRFAFLYPLFEMGSEHVLYLDEVMLVKNDCYERENHKEHLHYLMAVESHLRFLEVYPTLNTLQVSSLATSTSRRHRGDVLIFSRDSPLHLYACLESLYFKLEDINQIYVIYESHDHAFARGYLNLKDEFPNVEFFDVCDYPGNDFASLLRRAVVSRRHGTPYLLITDDHYVFERKMGLHACIQALEKVHADHFFVSLNKKGMERALSQPILIQEGIYAWQIGGTGKDQSPYMCLMKKSILEEGLETDQLKDLSTFEQYWKKSLRQKGVALFCEEKKALPLKLNREETLARKKGWGHKFIEGYKIDLPSLLCEVDEGHEDYPLIKREKKLVSE